MTTSPHDNIDESQEISLRIEQYEDIFSDFDVRPHDRRALSHDFLDEIKRASNDKYDSGLELNFHVPDNGRDESLEKVITERLRAHFIKHYMQLKKDKQRIIRFGATMFTLGVSSMIGVTYLIHRGQVESLPLSFLSVFLEPLSIFLLWEGLDQIIFSSKNVQPELDFYKKMAHKDAHIHFKSFEV